MTANVTSSDEPETKLIHLDMPRKEKLCAVARLMNDRRYTLGAVWAEDVKSWLMWCAVGDGYCYYFFDDFTIDDLAGFYRQAFKDYK